LPLTSNGKVDRNALSAPQVRSSLARARVPDSVDNRALDKIETSLLDIWRRHFKGQNIGVNQNCFELGGDSLDAFWLIGRCNKTFKTSLPLSLLFTHPTIERLADAIRSALAHEPGCQEWQNTYGNSPLVVFFPGIGGDNQISADFRSLFDGKLRFLVIAYPRWREMIKGKALLDAMIASSTVQIRRAYRPENCLLVGYSFGGMIAHEVANRLTRAGHPVDFLGLIDTQLPMRRPRGVVERNGIRSIFGQLPKSALRLMRMMLRRVHAIGQSRRIILMLLRLRAFGLLRGFCWVMTSLPLRFAAEFNNML